MNIRFPDMETGEKNVKRMSCFRGCEDNGNYCVQRISELSFAVYSWAHGPSVQDHRLMENQAFTQFRS